MLAFLQRQPGLTRRTSARKWGALILAIVLLAPWSAYAWLTITEHDEQVERAEHTLEALAAAYGEHATTLLRSGGTLSFEDTGSATTADLELSAFRSALNVPGVRFFLRKTGEPVALDSFDAEPDTTPTYRTESEVISAEIDRPAAGLSAIASLDEAEALHEWRERALMEGVGLAIFTVMVLGVAVLLLALLRRREAMELELLRSRDMAESANRAKSEFLANMSHELRTPLNAILGFSELVRSEAFGPIGARYRQYMADIHQSGTNLLELIGGILDLSELDMGRAQLDEQEFDLPATIIECVKLIERNAAENNIRIDLALDTGLRDVRADQRRMRQVIVNLLRNAIKFTPAGGVVTVTTALDDSRINVSIADTGAGMSADLINQVLTTFGQSNSKARRQRQGTGLGLPLSKHIVELHGGSLTITSAIDYGTAVTIHLPRERVVESDTQKIAA